MKAKVQAAEKRCQPIFERIEEIALFNTEKVLNALKAHQVAARHFAPTTGYGYDDVGRDTLERLFAELFHAEAAIVRPQIASGTHALSLCLFGLLRPGDELMYASGAHVRYRTHHFQIGFLLRPYMHGFAHDRRKHRNAFLFAPHRPDALGEKAAHKA